MAFTKYQMFLAFLQITTGSINTLSTKWADKVKSMDSRNDAPREFNHPFVQACAMFLGEFLCLLTFKAVYYTLRRRRDGSEDENTLTKGTREFNPFTLYIPALCDMVGTSLMYIGLNLTFASSFQMFRGAVIIFVALLSTAFLQRRLIAREWTGIFIIVIGLVMVGAADMSVSNSTYSRNNIITGDLLILTAQIITAIQMVYEEKYVAGIDIPALQAVGYEGLFGFATLSALLIPFYYIKVDPPFSDNSTGSLENIFDAFIQIKNSWQIFASICGTVVSIAFFNYAGISVTKEISATTRMVLDSVRTMVIWIFSISFRWQKFQSLQLGGFIFLLFGMCLYNDVLVRQTYQRIYNKFTSRTYGNIINETNIIVNRPADDTSNA